MYPSIDPRFMTAAEQHRVELVRPEQQCEPRESRRPYPVDHRTADAVVVGPQPHGTTRIANDVCRLVRTVLLTLAMDEDNRACHLAAEVPYWAPLPDVVSGHRAAASALRTAAEDCDAVAAIAYHRPTCSSTHTAINYLNGANT
jgi:hypothetical protein